VWRKTPPERAMIEREGRQAGLMPVLHRFFTHWNSRYANYKAMQEKVDKELDGSTTG
jgi:hypothetical protein